MIAWKKPGREIVLASTSPRRKEIMEKMGLNFSCVAPHVEDENSFLKESDIENSMCRLAEEKSLSVACKFPKKLVVGSDTIVYFDGRIIGKPDSRESAFEMLKTLSGNVHTVYSAVSLVCDEIGFKESVCVATNVKFRTIDNEIDDYLDIEEYADKAGAYAIQGAAVSFVEKIDGCFYNVMGLPVAQVIFLLENYVKSGKG